MTNQQPPVPDAARRYSAPAFLHTLGRVSRFASEKVLTSALVLYHCLRDKDTPVWAKGVITGALGYLILPTDLVPDLLPGAGYGDDWGAIVAALATVGAYIKEEHKQRAAAQVERILESSKSGLPAEFIE